MAVGSKARVGAIAATTTPTAEGHFDLINSTGDSLIVSSVQLLAAIVETGAVTTDQDLVPATPAAIHSLDFDLKPIGADATFSETTLSGEAVAGVDYTTISSNAKLLSFGSSYTNIDPGGSRSFRGKVAVNGNLLPLNDFASITLDDGTAVVVSYVVIS